MRQEKKLIGKYTYIVTQVDAEVGLEATARLANLLGPGFAVAPTEGGMNAATLGSVLAQVLSNPALHQQLKWFVQAFGECTQVVLSDTQSRTLSDIYREHFRGEVEDQLTWLLFAFEVNMGSFFARAKGMLAKLLAARKANSDTTSPTVAEPNGQSGALPQAVSFATA